MIRKFNHRASQKMEKISIGAIIILIWMLDYDVERLCGLVVRVHGC
jgi:hypothetical protein